MTRNLKNFTKFLGLNKALILYLQLQPHGMDERGAVLETLESVEA